MKKKQKRFYSNDKRGQKWTEPEVGRPIDFADKYIEPRTQAGQAELDRERRKKGPAFQKATPGQVVRRVLLVLLGLALLYVGYILMDAWMDLHAMPAAQTDTVDGNTISTVALEAKAAKVDSLSLDGAVMLDAMMDDLSSGGYTAACFDIKRAEPWATPLPWVLWRQPGRYLPLPGICAPLVKSWARMTCWCWGTLCAIRTMCRPLPIRPGR
jgi:hypothetical protein